MSDGHMSKTVREVARVRRWLPRWPPLNQGQGASFVEGSGRGPFLEVSPGLVVPDRSPGSECSSSEVIP